MSGSISASGLGKKYKRYPGHWYRLAEWLSGGRYRAHEELWALKEVTFTVEAGEAVGIVG
jgi:lipopolysaccharide transport system ATP-binding protein